MLPVVHNQACALGEDSAAIFVHAFENGHIATIVRVEAPHSLKRASRQRAQACVVQSIQFAPRALFLAAQAQFVLTGLAIALCQVLVVMLRRVRAHYTHSFLWQSLACRVSFLALGQPGPAMGASLLVEGGPKLVLGPDA